jgi:hypothetical protein
MSSNKPAALLMWGLVGKPALPSSFSPSATFVISLDCTKEISMASSQFHNVSDVCSAMKQFSTQTSQSAARGSFSTLDQLRNFSEALACLCDEITQLRAELGDVKLTQARKVASPRRRTPRVREAAERQTAKPRSK